MATALARDCAAIENRDGHGALRVERLSHRIDRRPILDDVGFSVGSGEVHALVGPSGCGKSTTLRLIAGLDVLQSGRVEICGRLVADTGVAVPPERRNVGLMFQDYALFPHLTVRRNIAFGLGRLPRRAREACVDAWLHRVGLPGYGERYPHQLSGGEQQRVALARALAPCPCLMLLDEAFSNLDTHLRDELRTLVLALLRETGTPTVLVTHDPDEAARAADSMHVMRKGRIVQSGTPAEVYARPCDLFVCSFFGQASRFKGWAVGGVVSTPFGPISRPDLVDGTAVDVVVRPDAVRLGLGTDEVRARVAAVRDVGPQRLAHLVLENGWTVVARLAADTRAVVGDEVALTADRSQIFVFPSA